MSILARIISTSESLYYLNIKCIGANEPLDMNIIMTYIGLPFLASAVLFHTFNGLYNAIKINELLYNTTSNKVWVHILLVVTQLINYVPYLVLFTYFTLYPEDYSTAYEWLPTFRDFVFIKFTLIAV
jgi:hypothetical protein